MGHYSSLESRDRLKKRGKKRLGGGNIHDQESKETKEHNGFKDVVELN